MSEDLSKLVAELRKEFQGQAREYYYGYLSAAKYDGCIRLPAGWHEKPDEELIELCIQAVLNQKDMIMNGHTFLSETMDAVAFEKEITKLFEMEKSLYDALSKTKMEIKH